MSSGAFDQKQAERQRALTLLASAVLTIEGRYGQRVISLKSGGWIYAVNLDGSILVIESKTGTVYARSAPGNPQELDPQFLPVSLATK